MTINISNSSDSSENFLDTLWCVDQVCPEFPALASDITADVCIIGAGISGITTAYALMKQGKSVVIIDDGEVGGGETGRTTAHLSNALDDRYYKLEQTHGSEGAKAAAESHTAAIDYIEKIVIDEKIECDFTRLNGYLFLAPGQDKSILEKEKDAAHRAGLTTVAYQDKMPVSLVFDQPCLVFPRQAQFHPLKYLNQLARHLNQSAVKIFTHTHASDIKPGSTVKIITDQGHTISANYLVIAANASIYDKSLLFSKQVPNRSYVIAGEIPKGAVTEALFWDNAEPYHYVRTVKQPDGLDDLLIIGGEDHRTGDQPGGAPFKNLETWARNLFPDLKNIKYQWSGQIMEPVDGLAFIGAVSEKENNIYIITGDSGNGMTHGTIGALLISDLILKKNNPWEKIYSPNRTVAKALSDLIKHNLTGASNYLDYLKPVSGQTEHTLNNQEGKIVQEGLKKIALYCDDSGQIHKFSAVCPHMKGIVHWNPIEKTWDCKAHGSRFSCLGKIINGPAKSCMEKI